MMLPPSNVYMLVCNVGAFYGCSEDGAPVAEPVAEICVSVHDYVVNATNYPPHCRGQLQCQITRRPSLQQRLLCVAFSCTRCYNIVHRLEVCHSDNYVDSSVPTAVKH